MNIIQTPPAGDNLLKYEGDTITFTIEVPENLQGKAYLRTNLFNSTVRQREIIEHAEYGKAILGRDWHDIEMKKNSNKLYSITLPLVETGYFAAKTLFVCEGEKPLVYWPEGENSKIKVEPAFTVGSNSIYTVFPRQFGLNKQSTQPQDEESIKKLDSNGYTVIPPSGTFRDVISELDHIICDLGFKILQVLPVHPVPTTYAKMGRFGSPFAAKDFLDVDHGCAEFDKSASPMDQFEELVDAVHLRSGKLFLDLPANHTGWASAMQEHHPEWFERNSDGSFKNPGAWGVIWGDLCELNYDCYELWKYMAEVFIFWCSKGVDGFRCDAGYMIPVDAWRYIATKVRRQFPHTIFMLEGLGGPIETTQKLLTNANLNWAYSELFQNYSQDEITNYCNNSQYTTTKLGTLVNFAETHDNDRLANSNYQYAMLRTAIAALFSQCGAFGITNGVEWFAKEKVDVHGNSSLNWGSQDNQIGHIKKLLQILKVHPCFQAGAEQWFIQTSHNNSLALLRKVENQRCLLIACNLEPDKNNSVEWKAGTFWSDNLIFNDLISDKKITTTQEADRIHLELSPGQVVCLSIDPMDIELEKCQLITGHNNPVLRQVMRSKAMEAWQNIKGFQTCEGVDFNLMADQLSSNPEGFLREMTSKTGYCNYVCWDAPEDANRVFIVPPKHFLLVRADRPFLAEMFLENDITERHYSLPDDTGKHFAIFKPIKGRRLNIEYSLKIRLLSENAEQITAPLLYTRNPRDFKLCLDIPHSKLQTGHDYALCTNKLGGMAQVSARWSEIYSKYDAFLASNLNANYPVDRFVSLVRFRAWIRYRDYSCELNSDCQTFFTTDMDNRVLWSFEAPIGMGKIVPFEIILDFSKEENSEQLVLRRLDENYSEDCLENNEPVQIIIRPDIDARSNHEVTKAYAGPEKEFLQMTNYGINRLIFGKSQEKKLTIISNKGDYVPAGEWEYMKELPIELDRGLEHKTDLYSPGYFLITLEGNSNAILKAKVNGEPEPPVSDEITPVEIGVSRPATTILKKAMERYIVKRDKFKTIIAGYPWFLDWGRDTLICLRGCISAGFTEESKMIVKQFASFEKAGTLPNMIRGGDDSNRETSDAPLWMFTAVADIIKEQGPDILQEDCDGRKLIDVLISIADNYIKGTNNGIRFDEESGLIFSPSHFTWMDTNYPAGTPRQGYPVEIQALWYAAISLLAKHNVEQSQRWNSLSEKISTSIVGLFHNGGGLSDCLHCDAGTPAKNAIADDHCRCNQLFAVTLGAIKDKAIAKSIINDCAKLIVPGAIRTLADRPVSFALPIYSASGELLNNPSYPYQGWYSGDEDNKRKPAYHNGTAWGWVYPSYCEAIQMVYGNAGNEAAKSIISSSLDLMKSGCLGHIPEIMDANIPHIQRGCRAQAWSVTELYRVAKYLGIK